MAAIDFKKLMAEELAKAKAKAFGKKNKKKESASKIEMKDNNNNVNEFMNKHLDFDELFVKFKPEIHKLPNTNTAYYIPNCLSESFSKHLLSLIYSAPKQCWTILKRRKLQCWGGKADINNVNKFNIETLPMWCAEICNKVNESNIIFLNDKKQSCTANHILINEYLIGQGIMPHKDGGFYDSRVCIISLISPLCINFYKEIPLHNNNMASPSNYQIILEPKSCLLFENDLYTTYYHTIHECKYDIIEKSICNLHLITDHETRKLNIGDKLYRQHKRISLTIRHVHSSSDQPNIIKTIDKTIDFLNATQF